jgi:3-isopropylmalate/(R)-2-methylmalate dehydratase small subunit
MESPECVDVTESGDEIEVILSSGQIVNLTRQKSFRTNPFPPLIQEIIDQGGMESYVRKRLQK